MYSCPCSLISTIPLCKEQCKWKYATWTYSLKHFLKMIFFSKCCKIWYIHLLIPSMIIQLEEMCYTGCDCLKIAFETILAIFLNHQLLLVFLHLTIGTFIEVNDLYFCYCWWWLRVITDDSIFAFLLLQSGNKASRPHPVPCIIRCRSQLKR